VRRCSAGSVRPAAHRIKITSGRQAGLVADTPTNPLSARDLAYNRTFKRKLGELADFSGRALVAAGIGGGVVAKLAQEKTPTTGLWELAMAIFGFALGSRLNHSQ